MKIAIIGTRGIPNHYGGFEQFAEFLSVGLVEKGHDVSVFNSSNHPNKDKVYKGVKIIHAYDPEHIIGTAGQFIYDLNSILKLKRGKYDIVLQLGYTSSSVWGWLLPNNTRVVTNMDGLEWKRSKFSSKVRWFLKQAERWAVQTSDFFVSDSIGIQKYLKSNFEIDSVYIPYGAKICRSPQESFLHQRDIRAFEYNMLVARLEPENNIEMILDGVRATTDKTPFLVVGSNDTKYGNFLKKKYVDERIRFVGGIYNQKELSSIRHFSKMYFHGHSVGGTNPSLLEAMACCANISAHDNIFNRSILGTDAQYFNSATQVTELITNYSQEYVESFKKNNLGKVEKIYNWDRIIEQYEAFFLKLMALHKQ